MVHLPTHYEPLESPMSEPASIRISAPIRRAKIRERADNPYAEFARPRFPYVLTTYRLTEHHTAGGMSRTLSHLAELQPELFCEISPELAAEVGITPWRLGNRQLRRAGLIEARALVTTAMKPIEHRRKARAPSGAALPLGIQRPGERRCRQRSDCDFRRAERPHHGNESACCAIWFRAGDARGQKRPSCEATGR